MPQVDRIDCVYAENFLIILMSIAKLFFLELACLCLDTLQLKAPARVQLRHQFQGAKFWWAPAGANRFEEIE